MTQVSDKSVKNPDSRDTREPLLQLESLFGSTADIARAAPKYHDLVNEAAGIILLWDTAGNISFFNKFAQSFFGFDEKEIIGRNVVGTIVPETEHTGRDLALQMYKIRSNPEEFEYNENENIKKNGERVWIAWKNKPVFDENGKLSEILSVGIDISERKQLEKRLLEAHDKLELRVEERTKELENSKKILEKEIAKHERTERLLKESAEKFRTIFNSSTDAIMLMEGDKFVDCNDATLKIFGCKNREDFLGKNHIDFSPPTQADGTDSRQAANQIMETAFRTGNNFFEWLHCRLNGEVFPAEILITPMNIIGKQMLLGTVRDITERKLAEAKFEGRSKVLELLTAGATLESILSNLVTTAEALNPKMLCSVVLLDEEQKHLLHGAAPSLPNFYNRAIDGIEIGPEVGSCGTAAYTGKRVIVGDVYTHPYWVSFRDLAEKAGIRSCWSEPVSASSGEVLGAFAIYYREPRLPTESDIRFIRESAQLAGIAIERRQSDEQSRMLRDELAHVARISTVGEMASGLAHEINQPLAAISNYTKGCIRRIEKNDIDIDELSAALTRITAQAERAAKVIQNLREFVSKGELQGERFDINALINEALVLVQSDARQHQVSINLKLAEYLPEVVVDRIQIQQVVLNLVRNGIEALSGSDISRRSIMITTLKNNDEEIEVGISDNGPGLNHEILDHLFEPFYTTKPTGMGMGLAISQTIIESHGGVMHAEPNGHQGLSIRFTLPLERK